MVTMAERLKRLRQEREWSQDDLAARIGVNRSTISHWEKGKRVPPLDMAEKLSLVFGVSVDYLLARTDTRTPSAPPVDLAARWPLLSPDRRQRAHSIERAYKGLSLNVKLPLFAPDFTDEEFDRYLRMSAALAQIAGEKKEPDHS